MDGLILIPHRIIGDAPRKRVDRFGPIAIDTETTGLDWSSELLGTSLAWFDPLTGKIQSCYIYPITGQLCLLDDGGPLNMNWEMQLRKICDTSIVIGHYLPFDYRTLYKAYSTPPIKKSYDTLEMARFMPYSGSLDLLSQYERLVGRAPRWIKDMKARRSTLSGLPPSTIAKYARWDAEATLQVFEKLRPEYDRLYGPILEENQAFSRLTMEMVGRGVPVDQDWLKAKRKACLKGMMDIQMMMTPMGLKNVGSDQQVGKYIEGSLGLVMPKRTPTGKPCVSAEELELVAEKWGHPVLKEIVKYRQFNKAIGSWIDDLEDMSAYDGCAHSILAPFGTQSWRMASSKINLQAVPLKDRGGRAFGSFAGVFKHPDPEIQLWQLDLGQAEVRMAAMVASENHLAAVLASTEDPYTQTALRVWADSTRRQDAKQAVLSSLYCIGANTYSITNKVTKSEAIDILADVSASFPNISRATYYWESQVIEKHAIPLPLSENRLVQFDPRDERTYRGFNQRVQGGVAEYMLRGQLSLDAIIPGYQLLQIHDSIVLAVHRKEAKEVLPIAKHILENQTPEHLRNNTNPPVPMKVDMERWDQSEEKNSNE